MHVYNSIFDYYAFLETDIKRLGKKIWHSLPDEVLENDKRISPEDLLNIGSKYQCAMNTW